MFIFLSIHFVVGSKAFIDMSFPLFRGNTNFEGMKFLVALIYVPTGTKTSDSGDGKQPFVFSPQN